MNSSRRNALLEKLEAQSIPVGHHPGPTVSIADFFEGNDDLGSIGCNLIAHPGVDKFYELFADILLRNDIQDVRVEIKDLVDEHSWPFADTIFVLTSMTPEKLHKLVACLQPDEVGQFPSDSTPKDLAPLQAGMEVVAIWWD